MRPVSKEKIWTIPNLMSLVRIALIPAIVWSYINRADGVLAGCLIVLSGLTDIADGVIARRFHQISDLGKALDPIADKLTQGAVLVCLLAVFPKMALPLCILAVKELLGAVMGLMVIRRTGNVYGARWYGKIATVILDAVMLEHVFWRELPAEISDASIYVCSAAIAISLVSYTVRNIRLMRAGVNAKKP